MTLYKSCRPLYDAIKLVTNDFDEKRLEKLGRAASIAIWLAIMWLVCQIIDDYLATW